MATLQDTPTDNISAATNGQTPLLLLVVPHQATMSLSWVTMNTASSAIVDTVPSGIDESTTDPIDVVSTTTATANKVIVGGKEKGGSTARYPN